MLFTPDLRAGHVYRRRGLPDRLDRQLVEMVYDDVHYRLRGDDDFGGSVKRCSRRDFLWWGDKRVDVAAPAAEGT